MASAWGQSWGGAWDGAWGSIGFAGFTLAQAISALVNAGFVVSPLVQTAYSATVPVGYVISQSPAAGANVPYGTNVSLVVSAGPAPVGSSVIPANYVGLNIWVAQDQAALLGLGLTNPVWQVNDAVAGTYVTAQSLPAGVSVPLQTPIRFTVSSGPSFKYPAQGGTQQVPTVH
jgi:serine/threonine-protein kinase